MKILNLYLFLIFLFISCGKKNIEIESHELVSVDTINPEYKLPMNKSCNKISEGYYNRYGLVISNFFEVTRTLPIDLNNDKLIDTLAILTPLSLIPTAEKGGVCFRKDTTENRLLIGIYNFKNRQKLYFNYPNVIANTSSSAWGGCEKMAIDKNGFVLKGYRGQGCVFDYNIYVLVENKELYIDSIRLNSSCSKQKSLLLNYKGKSLKLSDFNRKVIDSIKEAESM